MKRIFESLRPVIRWVAAHPLTIVLTALLLSSVAIYSARNLGIDTDLANLIPDDYPSKIALERLRETVGGESEVAVGIVSPSFADNKAFAEALIPAAMAMTGSGYEEPFLTRVDYRKETTFLKDNALYFATEAELDMLDDWLAGKIESSRLEANPFFFDLDEDEEEPDTVATELQAIYDDIVAKDYPVSDDSTTLVLRFYPSGAQTNIRFIKDLYANLEQVVAGLQPQRFNPEMEVVLAGRLQRSMIEVETIRDDVIGSFGAGVLSVLVMVLLYFAYKSYRARAGSRIIPSVALSELARTPLLGLVIALPLLMGLSWTFGLAAAVFGNLNLMTSTLGLVLFGLGIDFGIHFYARYTEERTHGRAPADAVETTFVSTGMAIAAGAFTTAAALFVLMFADFKGFSQFGFMAGTGILFALVAMLTIMPALLILFERVRLLNFDRHTGGAHPVTTSGTGFPGARVILVASVLMVVVAILAVGRVGFEYRFGVLEPTYAEYNARADVMKRVYDDSRNRNPAYVVVDDSSEVTPILSALHAHMRADTLSPTIDRVESLQERFPRTVPAQNRRLARLAEVRRQLDDPFLATDESDDMNRLRRAAGTTSPIGIEQVPEFLKEQFSSKNGELGNFILIYPSVGLSDGRQSIAFSEDVGAIKTAEGRVYHSGSTSLVAADMLKLMREEAPLMVLATFLIVVLLMYATFTEIKWALLALLPLVVGVLWMLFLMEFLDMRLNFYNLIVLPAVLGIGNDAGVHIVSRYRELGEGSIRNVLSSTGEHVTMASLTTMVGFAGLMLSFHPGLDSIGQLAVLGIGATLLAALLFLPSLLDTLEKRSSPNRSGGM